MLMLEDRYRDVIRLSDQLSLPDSLMDEVYYLKGKAYQSIYKFDSSYQCFVLAEALDSNRISYRVSQGIVLSRLGRNAEAIDIYEELRRDSLADPQLLTDLAALYANRSNWSRSLEIYEKLIAEDSLNYYYLKQAGKSSQAMNLPDSALSYFSRAFEINPADPYLTHQIANIYLKKKDLENAIFSMQRGFEYDTANIDLLKLRGYLWLLIGHYEMAVYDFESARDQDSVSVFIQKYLGMSYFENKQFEKASKALSVAFHLDSLDYETSFFLASSLRWSKREEESIAVYYKTLELMLPDSTDAKDVHLQLAELYKVLHRFDTSPLETCLRSLFELFPLCYLLYKFVSQKS
jgi:tetratricopeptide (TPR) repeat protein